MDEIDSEILLTDSGEECSNTVITDVIAPNRYKSNFVISVEFGVGELSDHWLCACGRINHSDEEVCRNCGTSLQDFKNTDANDWAAKGICALSTEFINKSSKESKTIKI